MLRTKALVMGSMIVVGIVSSLPAQQRESYFEYRFDDLDESTRTLLARFNGQLSHFSEGCSKEQADATISFIDQMAADATCGVAIGAALKGRSRLSTVGAVIACGWQIPKTLRDRKEKKENLKTCQELDELVTKYKKHCEGKTRFIFAFEDALYCYSPSDSLSLLVFDFKDRTVTIRR
ncbi:MAG TPA: hypothetical protein VHC22_10915 [Pirellulales bacterium]|nr:hypothetical protein [Pirellulales bacterium]